MVDKGSEFYNRSMKSWLKDNDIEIYSKNNEGKSVIAETFIKTLKNKIYKHITAVSNTVYIDKLDDIIIKYNNARHRKINVKPVDIKQYVCFDYSKEINDKDPKLKADDPVRI